MLAVGNRNPTSAETSMRVCVTGGTGLLGRALIQKLIERGDEVVCVTRDRRRSLSRLPRPVEIAEGDPTAPGPWQRTLDGCGAAVNLAGESLASGRWTSRRKTLFRRSRLASTRNLAQAVAEAGVPTLLSASAVGYYAPAGREPLYEEREAGGRFLSRLAHEWEGCALEAASSETRVALLRIGAVLAREGGALSRMIAPYRFGLGGPLGDPKAYFPWIHREDLVRAILFLLDASDISGPVNVVAPDPPTQREFADALGRALGRPARVRTPAIALKLALGEKSQLVLGSLRAVPKVLRANGFEFRYRDVDSALADLLR